MDTSVNEVFKRQAAASARFLADTGLLPSATASDPSERALGKFLLTQRADSRRTSPPSYGPARYAHLDEVVPGWREGSSEFRKDRTFRTTTEEMVAFVAAEGRYPSTWSEASENELRLAEFLRKVRSHARSPHNDAYRRRYQYLTEQLPGWREVNVRAAAEEADFLARARALAVFIEKHGRLPRQNGSVPDSEIKLGRFVRKYRGELSQGARATQHTRRRVGYLDDVVPRWREGERRNAPRTPAALFGDRVTELAGFVAQHGRLPSKRDEPRHLWRFLSNSRSASRGSRTILWTAEREALLSQAVPGWRAHVAPRSSDESMRVLRQFVAEHGRRPYRDADDPAPCALDPSPEAASYAGRDNCAHSA